MTAVEACVSDRIYRAEDDDDDEAHIPHATLWDHRLSVRARGLLAMLLCLRPGMSVSTAELAAEMRAVGGRATEGRDALRAARRELEAAGYLVTTRDRDERGRWVTHTRAYRRPRSSPDTNVQVRPGTENPAPVKPSQDAKPQVSPGTGNPAPVRPASADQAVSSSSKNKRRDDEDARARASTPPADLLTGRPALRGLAAALAEAGIRAGWPTDPARLDEITALVARHDVDDLVAAAVQQDANAAKTPGRTTAEYVTAYIRRWRSMTPSPAPWRRPAVSDLAQPPARPSRAEAAVARERSAAARAEAARTIAAARARAS